MHSDENKDPIEGKGEEMIPERGLPFDLPSEEPENPINAETDDQSPSTDKDQEEPEAFSGNQVDPENDLIPAEASPEGPAFPDDIETDTLVDFFDSVSEDYSPVLDDFEETEEDDIPQETTSPSIIRSPYSFEAEISANHTPEAESEPEIEAPAESEAQVEKAPLVPDDPSPWEEGNDSLAGLTGEDEAILGISDDFAETFLGEGEIPFAPLGELEVSVLGKEDHPFEEKPTEVPPPEEAPDDGMGTALEEAHAVEEIPAAFVDEGMSAGYPPTPAEALTVPTEPIAQPEPNAVSWAPAVAAAFPPATPETAAATEPAHHDHEHPHPEDQPAEISPEPGPHSAAEGAIPHDHGKGHPAKPEIMERLNLEDKTEALWIRADKVQSQINEYISDLTVAQKMLDYVQTARNEMLGGLENYEDAERYVNEVEFRVALNKRLKDISPRFIFWLFSYELLWAVGLIVALLMLLGANVAFASRTIADATIGTYLLGSIIWGGFGGAIGAILALIKHIAVEQDFDKQHTWWYYTSPPIGLGIGAVVFLFMAVGLYAIIGADGEISSPAVIYAFSWLAGYQHNVFTSLVKRMMKTLMGEQKDPDPEEKEMATLDNENR